MHLYERMECQDDALAREGSARPRGPSGPSDLELRAPRERWLRTKTAVVQAEFDPCGAEGSRSCGCLAVGSPRRGRLPELCGGLRGLNLSATRRAQFRWASRRQDSAEPFAQHFGGGLAATDGSEKRRAFRAVERWSPEEATPAQVVHNVEVMLCIKPHCSLEAGRVPREVLGVDTALS